MNLLMFIEVDIWTNFSDHKNAINSRQGCETSLLSLIDTRYIICTFGWEGGVN